MGKVTMKTKDTYSVPSQLWQCCGSGRNSQGQCKIPILDTDTGMSYAGISARNWNTMLLRSDGSAIACGMNDCGSIGDIPLHEGLPYTQVSAGGDHVVLLQSDCMPCSGLWLQ